jgi:murein DD-endopeptidase MepM/ murein hydrolase activator NlpD
VPKSTTPNAPARRALIEDIKDDRRGWVQHGVAALAISLLGLGVAGSVALTGSAQSAQLAVPPTKAATTDPDVKLPSAFNRDAESTSRDVARPALDQARLQSLADQRAEELSKTDDQIEQAANTKAAAARDKTLESASEATQKEAALIVRRKAAAEKAAAAAAAAAAAGTRDSSSSAPAAPRQATPAKSAPVASGGRSCMPVRGGYSIAARFGQVGSWSRYHTGMDVSAPLGSTVQAPDSGVVTNAGPGPASGWAGNYVAIRHSDGTTSMSSHMSTVTVSVGQTVGSCQTVGAVGMTGRTFGPHVHFEIYPAGVTPGDVYSAVNPAGWLAARGVTP